MSSGPQYPSIEEPMQDLASLQSVAKQVKEVIETMTGQRGNVDESSLEYRLRQLQKELTLPDGTTLSARVAELTEVAVTDVSAIARRTEIIEAEIRGARNEFETLAGRLENLRQAAVEGDEILVQSIDELTAEIVDARQGTPSLLAQLTTIREAAIDGDEAIARQITLYNTVEGDIAASIKEIVDARIAGDEAVTTIATEALAKGNMGTAGGNIRFEAISNPNTQSAVIDLEVFAGTLNPIKSGMRFKATAGSVGEVEINTDAFKLFDASSGAALPVFGYSSGKFTLNGNVAINGSLVLNGTILTEKIAAAALTNLFRANSVSTPHPNYEHPSFTTFVTVRDGARVAIWATADRNIPRENNIGFPTINEAGQGNIWDIYFGGNYVGSINLTAIPFVDDNGVTRVRVIPTTDHFFIGPLAAGTYAFTCAAPVFNIIPLRCTLLECAK